MRRTGKTTRLVNEAVETLFQEGQIYVPNRISNRVKNNGNIIDTFIDSDATPSNDAQKHFKKILLKRLASEHGDCVEIDENIIKLKKKKC